MCWGRTLILQLTRSGWHLQTCISTSISLTFRRSVQSVRHRQWKKSDLMSTGYTTFCCCWLKSCVVTLCCPIPNPFPPNFLYPHPVHSNQRTLFPSPLHSCKHCYHPCPIPAVFQAVPTPSLQTLLLLPSLPHPCSIWNHLHPIPTKPRPSCLITTRTSINYSAACIRTVCIGDKMQQNIHCSTESAMYGL